MGERYRRQVRKSINKLWSKAILELKEYVELLPLKQRIKLALNIVFKKIRRRIMNNTKIAWTEKTWNPVTGCTKYSEGCRNCYAEKMAERLKNMKCEKYKNGFKVTLHPECLDEPLKLKGNNMVFVCSMADLFHDDVPQSFIFNVMQTIELTPQNTYQILTKRVGNMLSYFMNYEGDFPSAPDNVWLGVTVEDKKAKTRIEVLTGIDAPVRFLSCEPLLEDLGELDLTGIDWVIVGGESGQNARPMKKDWVLNIKRQCEKQCVPFFFKQWGTWGEDGIKRNKKANGCLLDGEVIQQMPKVFEPIEVEEKFSSKIGNLILERKS